MMTPQQEAEELFILMLDQQRASDNCTTEDTKRRAKKCCIIAVDKIINSYETNVDLGWVGAVHQDNLTYWQQVKQEIEEL